jgi:lipopolysaccharide/colanic/teichoic acid biosynthesis glycosyltransferase
LLAKKGSLDLRAYPGIEVIEVEQPDQVNSADFDYLVFNPQAYYSLSWRRFFSHAQVSGTSVFTVAEINELLLGRISVDLLQESWVGGFFKPNYLYLVIKRFSDILVSLLLLPLVLLLGILVSVTILLTMGWPVLFVQQRVGREGKVFRLYKFRTMVKVAGVAGETRAQDPRITPVGACLRKLRLDELPQFYNVLKGDMSLIGPRPETVTLVEKYIQEVPLYTLRQVVRPGISGWAQVNQGYAVGVAGTYEKLRYDIYYVKHLSLALDLKILVKTLLIILTGQGAR